jgi:hypothetical protein
MKEILGLLDGIAILPSLEMLLYSILQQMQIESSAFLKINVASSQLCGIVEVDNFFKR